MNGIYMNFGEMSIEPPQKKRKREEVVINDKLPLLKKNIKSDIIQNHGSEPDFWKKMEKIIKDVVHREIHINTQSTKDIKNPSTNFRNTECSYIS